MGIRLGLEGEIERFVEDSRIGETRHGQSTAKSMQSLVKIILLPESGPCNDMCPLIIRSKFGHRYLVNRYFYERKIWR